MKTFKQIMYWVISCTWGIISTLIGAIITLALMITGHKVQKFGWGVYTVIGKNWGGLEIGPFFFAGEGSSYYIKCHEYGHSLQHLIFGPFMIFVVGAPSATRYWVRKMKTQKARYLFAGAVCLVLGAVCAIPLIFGCIYMIPALIVIGAILDLYFIGLFCWFAFVEIPDYKDGLTDYYSVWFERQASDWGQAFMKKYYPEIQE